MAVFVIKRLLNFSEMISYVCNHQNKKYIHVEDPTLFVEQLINCGINVEKSN